MKIRHSIVLLVILLARSATCNSSLASNAPAGWHEKLNTAIPEGIRLLEAKEYATFLQNFIVPEDLTRITKEHRLAEKAKEFGQFNAATVLKILQSIKDLPPTMSADGSTATFPLEKGVAPGFVRRTITFTKIDKNWYIKHQSASEP